MCSTVIRHGVNWATVQENRHKPEPLPLPAATPTHCQQRRLLERDQIANAPRCTQRQLLLLLPSSFSKRSAGSGGGGGGTDSQFQQTTPRRQLHESSSVQRSVQSNVQLRSPGMSNALAGKSSVVPLPITHETTHPCRPSFSNALLPACGLIDDALETAAHGAPAG